MGISGIGSGAELWKGLSDAGLAGISGSVGTGAQGIGRTGSGAFGLTDATGAAEAAGNAKTSAADKAFADVLQKAYEEKDKTELRKVCQQFESIMMSMMYKQMKATVPSAESEGDSQAREIYQGMLDDEIMTRVGTRGIGLADILFKQLSQQMDRTVKAGTETVESDVPAKDDVP